MSQHQLYAKGSKLDKSKLKKEKFFLGPEHGAGVCVFVRGMTVPEQETHSEYVEALKNGSLSSDERKNSAYPLLAMCLVDEEGVAMFADAKDVHDNFDVSAADAMKILETVNRLS